MPLLKVPSVMANVIFTEPLWACSVMRLSSLPGNLAYQRATLSAAVPPSSLPNWKNVTSALAGPRAISSCAFRIGDDGVTCLQPSGTTKLKAPILIGPDASSAQKAVPINRQETTWAKRIFIEEE